MARLCFCTWILILALKVTVCITHGFQISKDDRVSRERRQASLSGYRQTQTRTAEISITFINKSGRRIRMFNSSPYGHEIRFKFFLRPNEPKRVLSRPDGSFWVAYDVRTNYPMLINGRTRLETYLINPGSAIDARINSGSLRPERVTRDRKNPRFVETRVVVDKSMLEHHGEDKVFNYTIILMNMVSRSFLHRSLGAPVYIAVTQIHLMKAKPRYYRIIPDRPDISVAAACKYARRVPLLPGNKGYDFSLILTREDIGPAGYASMFTMCSNRSCALVKEKGPDAAFVIAHEMAHALGIDHDEDDHCPRDNLSGGNLMVKKLFATSYNYAWSRCSQTMIWQNLKYFKCLSNKPTLLASFKKSMDSFPGELMNKTEQCRHYHGKTARACEPKELAAACRYLWCRPNQYMPCQPVWWHSPLEGSPCAQGKWCMRGRCTKVIKRVSVDGGWSKWSRYKPACNINTKNLVLQSRNRSCTNPRPQLSGKKCKGIKEELRALLPTTNGICKPYSLKNLILSSKAGLKHFQSTGCENVSKLGVISNWRVYPTLEQRNQVQNMNLTCDFEKSGCQWLSSARGVKSWNIGKGKTPSAKTGPSFDHTFKNMSGHFLYFEASWIAGTKRLEKGDRVILQSPFILATSICLSFAYHMYGRDINALEVYIRNGKHARRMWSKKGNQGDKWFTANVELDVNIEFQITIEAVKGATYYSDIAIDDVSVTPGFCPNSKKQKTNHGCTVVCINNENTKMLRRQLSDGHPCKLFDSQNNVCFKKQCKPVNCHGIIGGQKC